MTNKNKGEDPVLVLLLLAVCMVFFACVIELIKAHDKKNSADSSEFIFFSNDRLNS